jgi:SGNH hydrolase-like domain, acetyltransferase AlgX
VSKPSEKRSSSAPQNRFERHPRLTLGVVLVCGLGVLLLAAELIARWAYPLDAGTSAEYRIPHPHFGWVLAPGASYVYRLPEESVPVSYNADGWRDRLHTKDKPEGVSRIVVLGDSYMSAYSVRFKDALSPRLESLLNTPNRPVEVINLGVGGYGTLQEYLVFHAFGRAYQPDIVVLAMYLANDLKDNSYEISSKSEGKSLKKTARPFLDPEVSAPGWRITPIDYEGALRRYEKHMRPPADPLQRLLRNSTLLQLAQYALEALPQSKVASKNEGLGKDKKTLSRFGKYYCSQPPEYDRAWALTGRILQRLDREVRAAGARLVVMSVPSVQEVDADMMAEVVRDAPEKVCMENPPPYEQLAKLLQELDIDYLNLLPAFREAKRQTGVELFRRSETDMHWNPQGHALAARELAKALKSRGYLTSDGAGAASAGNAQ